MPLFCSYHILTSSVIYYWTDARQHGIYLLNCSPLNFLPRASWKTVKTHLMQINQIFIHAYRLSQMSIIRSVHWLKNSVQVSTVFLASPRYYQSNEPIIFICVFVKISTNPSLRVRSWPWRLHEIEIQVQGNQRFSSFAASRFVFATSRSSLVAQENPSGTRVTGQLNMVRPMLLLLMLEISINPWHYHLTYIPQGHERIIHPPPSRIIQSDASKKDWGAVCKRIRTRGRWSLSKAL